MLKSAAGRIKLEGMAIVEQSFCHTFPVISTAQNYGEFMETKKQYLGIPKNRYQFQLISVVNFNLFVWFMNAKV